MRLHGFSASLAGAMLVALTGALIGCTNEAEPPRQASRTPRPFAGWVPTPPPTLQTYAACLERSRVTVSRLVGMYVVAEANDAVLASANKSCAAERQAHQQTITAKDFQISNEDGYRFVTQVRSCLAGKSATVPAEDEPVLLLEEHSQAGADFYECVEEIRARPTPTDF